MPRMAHFIIQEPSRSSKLDLGDRLFFQNLIDAGGLTIGTQLKNPI